MLQMQLSLTKVALLVAILVAHLGLQKRHTHTHNQALQVGQRQPLRHYKPV